MARILVIDDEELVRATIRLALEGAGHQVTEAENGNQGLAAVRGGDPFDVIVTDIIMPEKEGIETILDLKNELTTAKIIAISGGGRTKNTDYLKMSNYLGADATLAKPFSDETLIATVGKCLGS